MIKTLVQRTYCIDVTTAWLRKQFRRDARVTYEDSIWGKLNALDGVIKVEYNESLGPYVFLTLAVGHDTPETWAKIDEIIKGNSS